MISFICQMCNKVNEKPSYKLLARNWTKSEWLERKYCNDRCQRLYIKLNGSPKITRNTDPCIQCKKPTPRQNNYFCSMACKARSQDQGKTSANEKVRKSTAYKEWRKSIFERDNYTCVMCNQRGGVLHADHIKPFALHKELRLNMDNGRTLCVDCHKNTDTYGRVGMFRLLSVGRE